MLNKTGSDMTGVVELLLVRHGRPNRVEGVTRPDPALTATGLAQAEAVSEVMDNLPIRTVASSGLQRALQTAVPTATRLGIGVDVDDDLAELDLGADHYIPIEEISASDPRLLAWRATIADPKTQVTIAAFRVRVIAAMERVASRVESGVAAIFCHGGVIDVCVDKAAEGLPANRVDPEYGSITRIQVGSDGTWALRTYNEIAHVEALLR